MPSQQPSQQREPAADGGLAVLTLADLDAATAATIAVLADPGATAADRIRAAQAEQDAIVTFIEITATVAELAGMYRDAIARGELDGGAMFIISRNPSSARQGDGICGQCQPPANHGHHWSRLAAALREATRGEC
jgi:hypothetical protein